MRVLDDLPRSQHRYVIMRPERTVRTQDCGVDIGLWESPKVGNHPRDVLQSERCEIGPMLLTPKGTAKRNFSFGESPDVRSSLESKRAEPVVEIAALEGVSGIVTLAFTVQLGCANP